MGWTTPRTWTTGEVVTAALLNTHLKDNLRYLKGLDGAVVIGDDLTVDNLITAGNVDGVDVSAHKAGTAKAQHTAGAGDHTHQSAGAEGGQLDHGLALTGLGDDDHTQYVLRNILTTRGDLFRRGASAIERLALGSNGQYLKSDGTDAVWATPSMPTVVLKTADETVNNSNTLQNDDHLLFAVAANEVWEFLLLIRVLSNSDADFRYAFTIPTGASLKRYTDFGGSALRSELDGTTNQWLDGGGEDKQVLIRYVYIGGANAGNVQLQWAQGTATAFDTKVLTNSYILAHQLA